MLKRQQKIVVVGLGYIGLPTASILATKGHQVVGVDISEHVIKTINSGSIHIVEPDLDILVSSAVNSKRLRASLVPEEADTFILTVPTPFKVTDDNQKTPDISCVEAATQSIAPFLKNGDLVILESTSPVGTTEKIAEIISKLRPDLHCPMSSLPNSLSVHVAHCPERVLPGHIIRELVDNDRVIGGITSEAAKRASELYKTFCQGNIFLTDARTAEMTKLAENSFRDVNIAFTNELSMICDKLDINVWELIELANKHPRVNILNPGPGVGGHCIAIDPWFIVSAAPKEAKLIRMAREVNDSKPAWVIEKVKKAAAQFDAPVIGCLGLAFKANIDDLRESPALGITKALIAQNIGTILACEPNYYGNDLGIQLCQLDEVLLRSDIIVLLVDHDEFKSFSADAIINKCIIDTRGIWANTNNHMLTE